MSEPATIPVSEIAGALAPQLVPWPCGTVVEVIRPINEATLAQADNDTGARIAALTLADIPAVAEQIDAAIAAAVDDAFTAAMMFG